MPDNEAAGRCQCGLELEDWCDPTCYHHPDHPDNRTAERSETTMTDHDLDTELERILAMTPEELRADCEARGTTMEAEAAEVRACFDRALAVVDRARVVASVLSDHGIHISTPFDGDIDDAEREGWHACLMVSRVLS